MSEVKRNDWEQDIQKEASEDKRDMISKTSISTRTTSFHSSKASVTGLSPFILRFAPFSFPLHWVSSSYKCA